ncbi:hypothetical protein LXL04_024788 [Taraxacum kok-saghyz]
MDELNSNGRVSENDEVLGVTRRKRAGTRKVPVDPLEWQISPDTANSLFACLANTVTVSLVSLEIDFEIGIDWNLGYISNLTLKNRMIKGLPEIAGVSWKRKRDRIQSTSPLGLSSVNKPLPAPRGVQILLPSRDREKDTREIGERLDGADEPRGRESGRRQTLRRRDSRNRALQPPTTTPPVSPPPPLCRNSRCPLPSPTPTEQLGRESAVVLTHRLI